MRSPRSLGLGLALLVSSSCSLLGPSTTVDVRTFTPELPQGPTGLVDPPEQESTAPRLRLPPVRSGANLRTRIVHRVSKTEVDAYEDLRWTENPEEYVRRSLAHALFSEHPVVEAVRGEAPTLTVELVAFEEVGKAGCRRGRVKLLYRLEDGDAVRTSGTVTIERAAPEDSIEGVVTAISHAMDAASARLATVIAQSLMPTAQGTPAMPGEPEPEPPAVDGACVAARP